MNDCNVRFFYWCSFKVLLDKWLSFCHRYVQCQIIYGLEISYPSELATLSTISVLGSVTINTLGEGHLFKLVEPINAKMNRRIYFGVLWSKILWIWIFVKIFDKKRNGNTFITIFISCPKYYTCPKKQHSPHLFVSFVECNL